jgi:hypothetical protein
MATDRRGFLRSAGASAWAYVALAGCGEEGVTATTIRKKIKVEDLPEPVLKAAQKRLSDCKIQDAYENREKGITLQSYEIRGRNKRGKIREVRVSLTGEILEEE